MGKQKHNVQKPNCKCQQVSKVSNALTHRRVSTQRTLTIVFLARFGMATQNSGPSSYYSGHRAPDFKSSVKENKVLNKETTK